MTGTENCVPVDPNDKIRIIDDKPSKFYIHGTKEAHQNVKWNFDVEHITIEDINIDPIWLSVKVSITPIKECITTSFNHTKEIKGKCTDNIPYQHINNITKVNETKTQKDGS